MLDLSALSTIYMGEDSSLLTFDGTADFASEKKRKEKEKKPLLLEKWFQWLSNFIFRKYPE